MKPSSKYPVVCFGEVLWDILPSGPMPGGAPMNVAYHLQKLGTNAALITKIGNDKFGGDLRAIVSDSGITASFIQVDETHPTGLVYADTSDQNEVKYDIVYPSAWDFIEWKQDLKELVASAYYFVYGSLSIRHAVTRDCLFQLLDIANTKVFDINLRSPHFEKSSIAHLLATADVLKMNGEELDLVSSWFSEAKTTNDKLKSLQDKFNIDTLIVTLGGDGAMVIQDGTLITHPGFKVHVADTIGSGDSFLAAYLNELMNGSVPEDALEFAAGTGAYIATQQGACPVYETSQIINLIKQGTSSNVKTL